MSALVLVGEPKRARRDVLSLARRLRTLDLGAMTQQQAGRVIAYLHEVGKVLDELPPRPDETVRAATVLVQLPADAVMAVERDGREVVVLVACPFCDGEHEFRAWALSSAPLTARCVEREISFTVPSVGELIAR
jgi:hypothetical protein